VKGSATTAVGSRHKGSRYDARWRSHISWGARAVADTLGRLLRPAGELSASNTFGHSPMKAGAWSTKLLARSGMAPHRYLFVPTLRSAFRRCNASS